jgi:electron transport complex protein RnfC
MEDYSKFMLKSDEEIIRLLEGKDDFLVLACNKCFKKFTGDIEPECEYFLSLAKDHGKNITNSIICDFLCNSFKIEKLLDSLFVRYSLSDGMPFSSILVISCGIGTQTIAGLVDYPVFTLCDSIGTAENHGLALTEKLCSSCGQCFLKDTGGICPITDCAKGLINGQCGGEKDGKCETDSEKNCAWLKISERLSSAKKRAIFKHDIKLYDNSKIKTAQIKTVSNELRKKRYESFYGGLHLKDKKELTNHLPLVKLPPPKKVIIPMSQHAGMSADPIVRVGDHVKRGQKVGEAVGVLSSSVHASVSGIVTEITSRYHPNSSDDSIAITIESDGKDTLHKSVIPIGYWEDLDIEDIDAIIAEKGIVGMGGAGFPTPVKLKSPKPIDTIILNGCESEPYITADHRIMLEYAQDVLVGLNILLKSTEAQRGVIVIGDNKRDAIANFLNITSEKPFIDILPVKVKYPQGAEKMLISRALGRKLSSGQRPYDVGVIVINVSTAKAIADAFQKGLPLVERAVTVSGSMVKHPGNFLAHIGTPVKDFLTFCEISDVNDDMVISLGGPMMGVDVHELNVPIIKGTNGIIVSHAPVAVPVSPECVRCGRCVDVCPMELLPLYYPIHAADEDWDAFNAYAVSDCMECGCCDYVCPSRISIRKAIRLGKEAIGSRRK